jgi:peptidoglycan/LPS O-acetylase OafA/YrhL
VSGRIPELDLLRFSAAAAVLLYHLCGFLKQPVRLQLFTAYGFAGVHLFFMISGFVILMTAERRTAAGFVVSRFARLYPTFWTCLLVTTLALTAAGRAPGFLQWLANLTMIPLAFGSEYVDHVYWSLVVELQFYALALGLLLIGQMARIELWLFAWLCIGAASLVDGSGPLHTSVRLLALYPFGPLFMSGCYCYLLYSRGWAWRRILPLCACCALSVVLAMVPVNSQWWLQAVAKQWPQLGQLAALRPLGALIVVFHLLFVGLALRWWRLPHWPLWATLGSLTYPLYLLHDEIGYALWPLLPFGPWLNLALEIALMLLLAALVAELSEKRLHRWVLTRLNGVLERGRVQLVRS